MTAEDWGYETRKPRETMRSANFGIETMKTLTGDHRVWDPINNTWIKKKENNMTNIGRSIGETPEEYEQRIKERELAVVEAEGNRLSSEQRAAAAALQEAVYIYPEEAYGPDDHIKAAEWILGYGKDRPMRVVIAEGKGEFVGSDERPTFRIDPF